MKVVSDPVQKPTGTTEDTPTQSLDVIVNRSNDVASASVLPVHGSVIFLEVLSEYESLKELFFSPSSYHHTDPPRKLAQYFIPSYRSDPFNE